MTKKNSTMIKKSTIISPSLYEKEKDYKTNLETAAKLFHTVWGEAHDSPDYNKQNWIELQNTLFKLGIKV